MSPDVDEARPLVFLHVPKCMGNAVRQAINRQIPAEAMLRGMDPILFGGFTAFETVSSEMLRTVFFDGLPTDPVPKFVTGHLSLATIRRAYPHARIFTVLREARSRLVSHFLYWRSVSDARLKPWGAWAASFRFAHGSLIEFLEEPSIACQTDNLATRLILGPHKDIPVEDFIPTEKHASLFEAARDALGTLDFVTLAESPSIDRDLAGWLGSEMALTAANVTPRLTAAPVSLVDEITVPALQQLERLSAIDQALWRSVAERNGMFTNAPAEAETIFLRYLMRQAMKQA